MSKIASFVFLIIFSENFKNMHSDKGLSSTDFYAKNVEFEPSIRVVVLPFTQKIVWLFLGQSMACVELQSFRGKYIRETQVVIGIFCGSSLFLNHF